jgi:hypothetical protein
VLGPVVDGRFAGFMSAHGVYGTIIDVAQPLDPLGSPAAEAFLSVKNTARSAFGASPVKQLVAVPLNWYDVARSDGWSTFTATSTGTSGQEGSTSTGPTGPAPGDTPPIIAEPSERFAKMWRWRTLDEAAIADVVVPSLEAVADVDGAAPAVVPVVQEHRVVSRMPLVADHQGIDLSEVSVLDRGAVSRSAVSGSAVELSLAPAPAGAAAVAVDALVPGSSTPGMLPAEPDPSADSSEVRVLATASRRQLVAALGQDQPAFARLEDVRFRSTALARLVELEAPVLVQEIDDDTETSSTQSVESHQLTLSLEYCFVQISRDAWWNDGILRMPRWYAPGCRAGAFTAGAPGGPPLGVPIALVLTRDVSVTGRWSESDRTAATSHTSFGPWSTRESTLAYDEQTRTATLRMPHCQVVAVVCALLPPLAPADDPTSGPAAGPVAPA